MSKNSKTVVEKPVAKKTAATKSVKASKTAAKKSEAKAIAATLDEAFASIGFTRTLRNQVPNLNDATIYRVVCRYEAIVDRDLWIYHN